MFSYCRGAATQPLPPNPRPSSRLAIPQIAVRDRPWSTGDVPSRSDATSSDRCPLFNRFLYHLASGQAWFSCGLVVVLLIALDLRGTFAIRPLYSRIGRVLLLVALCVAGITATPVPLWLAIPLVASSLAYAFFGFAGAGRGRRRALALVTGACVVLAMALELPYHIVRPPRTARPQRAYVVADSLAAGLGGEAMTWPRRLGELTGVEIRDLSFAGANAGTALRQQLPIIERDDDPEARVLVCIGGNDMLGRTTVEEFGQNLDELLAAARGDPQRPREVLMLELPLIPGAWKYGSHQRRLAAKHGVVLIPKRLMAGVVLDDADVLDGVHLSPAGHERMARELAAWLGQP
jgi:acyl-CoA thioesterase-1